MTADQPAASGAVEVSGLTIDRGRHRILTDVTFTIPPGRITGLLGPSGSGKTTLMRAIVGAQKISGGSAVVLGKAAGHPSLRHSVGYMTQDPSVYPDLTVEANVRYFGSMTGAGKREAQAAVDAVGLGDFSRRKARDLSGGQFSRVSLACALVARPEVLVLDEPTVGLDPVLRVDLWKHFARLAAEGTTLIVSSHVMEEAGRCDSLLLLREGKLLAQLTPQQLRQRGGTDDLELAFFRLIQDQGVEVAS